MKKYQIEDFDLDLLDEQHAKVLKLFIEKPNIAWSWGLMCGIMIIAVTVMTLAKGTNPGAAVIIVALLKGAIFILLGLWVRSWSLTAAILLLGWHLFSNANFIFAHKTPQTIFYIGFGCIFLWGLMGCLGRRKLIKKALKRNKETVDSPSASTADSSG